MALITQDLCSMISISYSPLIWILIVLTLLLVYLERQSRTYKMGNKLPGPLAIPLIGHSYLIIGKTPDDFVNEAFKYGDKYGDVVRMFMGSKLGVFIRDPKDVEVILDSHIHIDKADEYRFFEPWLGNGLLISTGEKWRADRKMIAPTFHTSILKSFMGIFNENSRNVVRKMQIEIGKTFDVHKYMSGVTVDILLETVMGLNKRDRDDSSFEYAMAVLDMCDVIHQRHTKIWLFFFDAIFKLSPLYRKQQQLLKVIHGLSTKVIKRKQEEYAKNKTKVLSGNIGKSKRTGNHNSYYVSNDIWSDTTSTTNKNYMDDLDANDENDIGDKKRMAFLDLMVESANNGTNNISDNDIKEQVDTIMFEGHDTTAAAASFALCLLGLYKDIQNKVYEELHEIFGDSDREATFDDTVRMKYLERTIFETLRMYSPVPLIGRKLKQDVKIVTNNYVLPAGTTVLIVPLGVNRHPKYYKNPDMFDPDNFLPENAQNRPYYSYIPFSAGPRSCVGRKYAMLKLKVLLSTILRKYRVFSDVQEEQFVLRADIILKRSDGFNIKIEPRIKTQ